MASPRDVSLADFVSDALDVAADQIERTVSGRDSDADRAASRLWSD